MRITYSDRNQAINDAEEGRIPWWEAMEIDANYQEQQSAMALAVQNAAVAISKSKIREAYTTLRTFDDAWENMVVQLKEEGLICTE